jgi:predicted secreted Zn-dependent protease
VNRRAAPLAAAGIGWALALCAAGAAAKPVVVASTEHYRVVGASESELRHALETSPLNPDGRRRVGYTQAEIRWQYEARARGGKCRVVSVTVTLTVKTTLPQWEPQPGASGALRRSWARFFDALSAHEQGHSDIALAAAKRIEDALWRAPMPKDCTGYGPRLDAMANALFDESVREQDAFDQRTDYGAQEGVRFP